MRAHLDTDDGNLGRLWLGFHQLVVELAGAQNYSSNILSEGSQVEHSKMEIHQRAFREAIRLFMTTPQAELNE
jgi:hypothetical protein